MIESNGSIKYAGVSELAQETDLKSVGEITSSLGVRLPSPVSPVRVVELEDT